MERNWNYNFIIGYRVFNLQITKLKIIFHQLLELKDDLERMKYQPTKDEEDEDFEEKIDSY